MKTAISRRALIASGAAVPFVLDGPISASASEPPYTLSINIEIMFPRTIPRAQRVQIVADHGFKAYGFWNASEEEQDAMLKVQQATGLKCSSITGPGSLGSSSGLTKPGQQQPYLDEITARVVTEAANRAAVRARLFVRVYQEREAVGLREGPWVELRPGEAGLLRWTVPASDGWPVADVLSILARKRMHRVLRDFRSPVLVQ